MKQKVEQAQHISRMCAVCGTENGFSLKAHFYDLENGEIMGVFHPTEEHQSYPGRMHGGFSSAILDETIGRAINCGIEGGGDEIWGVTIELTLKFRKPVPLDRDIKAVARITKETSRTFEGTGEILLDDGTVAVEARGTYMKLPAEKISDGGLSPEEWFPDDRGLPENGEIEVPSR